MNLNDGAVYECVFKVGVTAHGFEKTLEYTRLGPATKATELGRKRRNWLFQLPKAGGKSRQGVSIGMQF